MGQPGAKITSAHVCPMVTGMVPHVGGPVTQGSPDVMTGGQPAARVGDQATCTGPPDFICVGASMVLINGRMAARLTSNTVHGGLIVMGDPMVLIGSASAGGTVGAPGQGLADFNSAASGRTSGSVQQSYSNCGIEATRLVLEGAGVSIDEDALLNDAIVNGNASPSDRYALYQKMPRWLQGLQSPPPKIDGTAGGSGPSGRNAILNRYGVDSSLEPATMDNIAQAVAEGKGVVTSHDTDVLWNDSDYRGTGHAVEVLAVEYDDAGNVTHVIVNDTGKGVGQDSVPIDQYQDSLRSSMNVTDASIHDPTSD